MKRGTFILLCALGITAISTPTIKWLGLYSGWNNRLAQPKLLSHLFSRKTLRTLGKSYLALKPDESNCTKLVQKLLGPTLNAIPLQKLDIPNLQAHIEEMIKEDFVSGRTIVLNGWILSMTEARQCAYFSILNS